MVALQSTNPAASARVERHSCFIVILILPCVLVQAGVNAEDAISEDVVYFEAATPGHHPIRRTGEVLDFTGEAIRIRSQSGVERDYPIQRILRLDSNWSEHHLKAEAAWARGDYRQTIVHCRRANREESRVWVRRKILARLITCLAALHDFETAADSFLLLATSDAKTPYLHTIPLAWQPGELVRREKAVEWMARKQEPFAVLLGASHLMSTDQRPSVVQILKQLRTGQLRTGQDPRVVALAEAQIWRSQLVHANEKVLENWARRIANMPERARAGPYLVLGQGLMRQGLWEQAAMAFLHVGILDRELPHLAAPSSLMAAHALMQLDQEKDAKRLLREVVQRYGETKWKIKAQERLDKIGE